jgi:hypothetical protein
MKRFFFELDGSIYDRRRGHSPRDAIARANDTAIAAVIVAALNLIDDIEAARAWLAGEKTT